MGMIGHKHPRITAGLCLRYQGGQTLYEIFAIKIIFKNRTAFNPANNNMVHHTWRI
jgi:hypothetical protein